MKTYRKHDALLLSVLVLALSSSPFAYTCKKVFPDPSESSLVPTTMNLTYECGSGPSFNAADNRCDNLECRVMYDDATKVWTIQSYPEGHDGSLNYYVKIPASKIARTTDTAIIKTLCPIAFAYPDANKTPVARWNFAGENCTIPQGGTGTSAVCQKNMGNGLTCGNIRCDITVGVDYGNDLPLAYYYKSPGDILPKGDVENLMVQRTLLVNGTVVQQYRNPVTANEPFAWTAANIQSKCNDLIAPPGMPE